MVPAPISTSYGCWMMTAAVGPVTLQIENQGLKVQERLRGVSHERKIYHEGGIVW